MVNQLSKHQREFLLGHSAEGFRPFKNEKQENDTRTSLIQRKLLRYEPETRSRIGCPSGTMLTDIGREARAHILGDYADALVMAMEQEAKRLMPEELKQLQLYRALADCAAHWRREYSPPAEGEKR